MRVPPGRFIRTSFALSLSVALAACGGGGGGNAGTTAPPSQVPPVSAPLLLTTKNAEGAGVVAFSYGALAVAMSQLAVDWTSRAEGSPNRAFNTSCVGGGSASGTLADSDGDGRAGPGERVTVTLAGCYVKELDDTMDGSVTITFTTPAASQQRAGVVAFSGLKSRGASPSQEIVGALRFDYSAGHLSKMLHVASDAQPFGMRVSDGKTTTTDNVTALDASHETRLDTMRATTSMRFNLDSALLGGTLTVTTGTPWLSWFDAYPDAGQLDLAGADGGKVSLRARAGDSTADVLLAGAIASVTSIEGPDVLWTGAPWLPEVAAADHYATKPSFNHPFTLLRQPDSTALLPNGALTWLYSHPINAASIGSATFVQRSGPSNTTFEEVPATVTVEGGLLTITPTRQLQPGIDYQLRVVSGNPWHFSDTAGATLDYPAFTGTVARTISASLVSAATPLLLGADATLVLDASGSTANGVPVASTHWRQLSGPALSFSDPDAARVTIGPAAKANGTAVVELTVANAAGEVDRKTISVTVAADQTQSLILSYRVADKPLVIAAGSDPDFNGSYARRYPDFNSLDVLMGTRDVLMRFMLASNQPRTWTSGLKLTYSNGNVAADTAPGWVACMDTNHTGTVSFLDYAQGADGSLERLALDFDDTCGTTVTVGSIRYRSTIPIRP